MPCAQTSLLNSTTTTSDCLLDISTQRSLKRQRLNSSESESLFSSTNHNLLHFLGSRAHHPPTNPGAYPGKLGIKPDNFLILSTSNPSPSPVDPRYAYDSNSFISLE